MSDTSQDVEPGAIAERLADLIEGLLNEWPGGQRACKVTLDMTFDQWNELLGVLRLHRADEDLRLAAEGGP